MITDAMRLAAVKSQTWRRWGQHLSAVALSVIGAGGGLFGHRLQETLAGRCSTISPPATWGLLVVGLLLTLAARLAHKRRVFWEDRWLSTSFERYAKGRDTQ